MAEVVYLDENWFKKYRNECHLDLVDLLQLSNMKEIRERFLENSSVDPDFSGQYTFSKQYLHRKKAGIEKLYQEVCEFNPDFEAEEAVKQAYLIALDTMKTTWSMLAATYEGKDSLFYRLSQQRDGVLDHRLVKFAIQSINLEPLKNSNASHHRQAFKELSQVFREAEQHLRNVFVPSHLSEQTIPTPPPAYTQDEVMDAEALRQFFCDYIDSLGMSGWTVEIETEGKRRNMAVSPSKKTVWIPCDEVLRERRIPELHRYAEGKAKHEIGTHAYRGFRGSRSPLQLLSLGLPGYVKTEEGVGAFWEISQETRSRFHYPGNLYYLRLAFADGTLTGKPHGFADTFRFLFNLLCMDDSLFENQPTVEQVKARAWNGTWRVFRGTTGQSPGCCWLKDQVYLRGSTWALHNPEFMRDENLYVGKYDPENPQHCDILRKLDVL